MLRWIEERWTFIAFVLIAMVVVLVIRQESNTNVDRVRKAAITVCIQESQQSAFQAAFDKEAADTRRREGKPADIEAADFYDSVSMGLKESIPRPRGVAPSQVAAVQRIKRGGKTSIALTPAAGVLQREGCAEAY